MQSEVLALDLLTPVKNAKITITQKIEWAFVSAVVLLLFLAYLVPLWYAFFFQHPFIFTNAWDNANYLSYQGALTARNWPGYFPLYLVIWLQHLGLSGAIQNLIFESIFPPLILYLVYRVFLEYKIPAVRALNYAAIVLFASVLFNYSNIHIAHHFLDPASQRRLITGWETYPSVIRAPNPQFSYLLLAFFVFLYVKFKKNIYLFLPLPLLYFFVLAPYLYILIVACWSRYFFHKRIYRNILFANGIAYLLLAAAVYILFGSLSEAQHVVKQAQWYVSDRNFLLPLVGCFGILIYLFLKIFRLFQKQDFCEFALLTIVFCSFVIVNLQLITGFSISIKNYQDYGNSILAGFMIVILFEVVRRAVMADDTAGGLIQLKNYFLRFLEPITRFLILVLMTKYALLSQNFSFSNYGFQIDFLGKLNDQQIARYKQDPLHAIVLNTDFSQRLPYGYANMLAPVFSYQYNYSFVNKQCHYNELLANNALQFVRNHYGVKDPVRLEMEERAKLFFSSLEKFKDSSYANQAYCNLEDYQAKNFYVIAPDQTDRYRIFPKW